VSQVRERSGYAHEVLDGRMRTHDLSATEAALATRLAYGTIQTQGALDEALARFLGGKKLEPRVRDALRVSAYEILFLHTPTRAAVHQGVELVRSLRPQAAGLANAVLRRLAEEAADFPWGDTATDDAALARKYGHPLWLAQLWIRELGRSAAEEIMAADNEPAPLYVAANAFAGDVEASRAALRADGALPQPCPLEGCVEVGDAAAAVRGQALREGFVVACDAAAQLVARLVQAQPGQRIVEIGSGRGTKTMLMQAAAVHAGGPADIYAVDLHAFKARLLEERLERFGVPWVHAVVGDARDVATIPGLPASGEVDSVLVDAPCSGLGTLRRHPEKRWRVEPADLEALGDLGKQLLTQAASLVRPGGFVVYSTCTIAQRENADVIEAFLASPAGEGWRVEPVAGLVPAEWNRFMTREGYFSSYPVVGGPDGHFAARLVRGASD
jgi:16S rRNA (cytosine967-C5)-methyltransferase